MKQLVCEMCGSTDLMKQDGVFVCQSCGIKYSVEEAKKMMVEGIVEVHGTVKVDNTHYVDNYLEMAQTAIDSGNNQEAEKYCNKILEIEPTNYKALMLKGEAVAWQSTMRNLRVDEGVSAFIKGIDNAPEDERGELVEVAKEQIKRLSIAMISMRAENFAKWPDEEESAGFLSDLTAIINTVISFISQTDALIQITEIMAPIADKINQSVVKAYRDVIRPEYKSERYPWPDDDDFFKYIKRIGYCTSLVERAIGICDEDDDKDVTRYENLIFFHTEAIEACSYDWEYTDLSSQWLVEQYKKKTGYYPVARENRVYMKNRSLTKEAVAMRRNLISQYKAKIKEIKDAQAVKEAAEKAKLAAEKAEKERIAREAAQARREAYWANHIEEKNALENEKNELMSQVKRIDSTLQVKVSEFKKEKDAVSGEQEISIINDRIEKLTEKMATLGIFKGKEKKAIQQEIYHAENERKSIKQTTLLAKNEIDEKISAAQAEANREKAPLMDRIATINKELNKDISED